MVVLFNVEEQCQRHYTGHTDDVKCLAVHPNKLVVASGQCAGHDRLDARVRGLYGYLQVYFLCCALQFQFLNTEGSGERIVYVCTFQILDIV